MEPASGAVVAGLAKGASSVAGKMVAQVLRRRLVRPFVSRAVVRRASAEGITIDRKELSWWLGTKSVQSRLERGDEPGMSSCAAELEAMASVEGGPVEGTGAILLLTVRDECLRRMAEGDARVEMVRRTEPIAPRHPSLLRDQGDHDAFESALAKLHPWRAADGRGLGERWPAFRQLVITLTNHHDRRQLLNQWCTASPDAMDSAPAEGLCWFATVAADYGAEDAALGFIERAVAAGADQSYWRARAGLMIGNLTPGRADRSRGYWAISVPPHPLALAGLAIDQGRYADADAVLDGWHAPTANDESIRAILRMAAAAGAGEFNRAITVGLAASAEYPESSGLLLKTAEALIARGHHGPSDHPLDDFAQALRLAVSARDARRSWLGDSVAPALIAVRAAVLASDADLAWQLTQPTPEGDALLAESRDRRLQREAAVLAAMRGSKDLAVQIARELDEDYITQTVAGWSAMLDGEEAAAEAAWLIAWDLAPSPNEKVQAAAALAPLGRTLPDLTDLTATHSAAVKDLQRTHEVMSAGGDRLTLLRARAPESEILTVQLAEVLSAQGEFAEAAAVLERGANMWTHPLLMKMAADRYMRAGLYAEALNATGSALALGGQNWAGRAETLMIQFDALQSLGDFDRALAVVRELVTLIPDNLTARWALVYSLLRRGDLVPAWNALTHNGELVSPRTAEEARTWIGLVAECDDSTDFVARTMDEMSRWTDEPDVIASFLLGVTHGLARHDREVAEADLEVFHRGMAQFFEDHPNHPMIRRIDVDPSDVAGSLISQLRANAEDPAVESVRKKIEAGELPLGLLSDLYTRAYLEIVVRRGAGMVYAHDPGNAADAREAAQSTLGCPVVIDTSAAVTLAVLDPAIAEHLYGSFSLVETTDTAYRDGLAGQQSLALRTTTSIGLSDDREHLVQTSITQEEADLIADTATRTVRLLAKSARHPWSGLHHFQGLVFDGGWLSALDFALTHKKPFWCDDRILRALARQEGIPTFGTLDLLTALEANGTIEPALAVTARASALHNWYVDLDFDANAMTLAAELAGWRPEGAAAALARPFAWADADKTMRFVHEALKRVATMHPESLRGWIAGAAIGLVRIAGGDDEGASDNLDLLLSMMMTQPWVRPEALPDIIAGIRDGMRAGGPAVTDPLRRLLTDMYQTIAQQHGATAASQFLLQFVASLTEQDRALAANVILTARD